MQNSGILPQKQGVDSMKKQLFLLVLLTFSISSLTAWELPEGFGKALKNKQKNDELLKLAKNGDIEANYQLAQRYEYGRGVKKDLNTAIQLYYIAAKKGHCDSQFKLGYLLGEAKAYTESAEWYLKAAEQGHSAAQYNLAHYYRNGNGVAEDHKKAVKWFLKAAEQGDADAQFILGCYYVNTNGVFRRDYSIAAKWHRKAANQGHSGSQFLLGYFYESGKGVPKSYDEAVKWYQKAANQGHKKAQQKLKRLRRTW